MFRLDKKVALVSGAGRGMGFGVAQALATQGATVIVNDFHADRAEAAARQLRDAGFQAHAAAADMTDRGAIFAMVEQVLHQAGAVDIFVHNAGIPAQGWGYTPFLQSPESEWNAWLQLNLHGLMHACQALLPGMIERRWGRVVAINSDAARTATGMGLCAYGAAKAAAAGFIRNLSGEVGPHGVTANALSLGTMNNWEGSEKIARKGTSVGRAGSPQDVGAAVVYLASPEAEWVNGQVLAVNGGSLVA
ncbi:3-oxoacyl-[acyl-carrier protein] reductase [Oryzisolibacter propanilivorax]|uniref:3-oxoacyl-[acyl-carrier protein] reductase n=1 Tax=Oryzisolibacter propanilivorax TaxID=1527607 RepID=A0A1G9NWI3_9BURK|nr:SDR family oxidoreductase [Oryzisolibacter propanilivorax]SDL90740.1 3-oxoacyl-[acyl-carrier protein] reductase [Oryzisolibacter propanilivorax]